MNEVVAREKVEEIKGLIEEGVRCWTEAGQKLVRLLDAGSTLEELAPEIGVGKDILSKFVAIGRGQIHPELMTHTSPAARRLVSCDVSEQRRYLTEPLPLLVLRDQDQTETMQVQLDALTPEQARQVIDRDHVRDLAEQRAWLEDQLEKRRSKRRAAVEDAGDFVIKGHKVVFKKGVSMTKDDLIKIAARL